jgi:hypothetical protein
MKITIMAIGLLILGSGCRHFTYEIDPEGNTKFDYLNVGFDTKVGKMAVTTPRGVRVDIEQVDSSAVAVEAAANAVKAVADKIPTTRNLLP